MCYVITPIQLVVTHLLPFVLSCAILKVDADSAVTRLLPIVLSCAILKVDADSAVTRLLPIVLSCAMRDSQCQRRSG